MKPPVRPFVDEGRDIVALRSDIPIPTVDTPTFAADLTVWLDELTVTPIYLSGHPGVQEPEATPTVYVLSTGAGERLLAEEDIAPPIGSGTIGGPAGALLSHARARNLDSLGLIVETDPRFPDPQGARVLVDERIRRTAPAGNRRSRSRSAVRSTPERLARHTESPVNRSVSPTVAPSVAPPSTASQPFGLESAALTAPPSMPIRG